MNKAQFNAAVILTSLLLTALASTTNIINTLQQLGIDSILTKISLTDSAKIYISLQLTLTALCVGMLAFSLYFWQKRMMRRAGILAASSSLLQAMSVIHAFVSDFSLFAPSLLLWACGLAFSCAAAVTGLTTSGVEADRMPMMLPYEIAVSTVLSALTAVITIITGAIVPSPTGGYTHIGDLVIFVAALLFGCKIGGTTGIIGSVVADFWLAYPRWYVSIPAHGLEGIIAGFGKNKSLPIQAIFCACAGFVMASTYFYINIFIKGYPLAVVSYLRDLFGQAAISIILALIVTKSAQKARLLRR